MSVSVRPKLAEIGRSTSLRGSSISLYVSERVRPRQAAARTSIAANYITGGYAINKLTTHDFKSGCRALSATNERARYGKGCSIVAIESASARGRRAPISPVCIASGFGANTRTAERWRSSPRATRELRSEARCVRRCAALSIHFWCQRRRRCSSRRGNRRPNGSCRG